MAEGEKLVGELEGSGFTVREVYRVGENVTVGEMERISFLKTPTPVLAVAEIPYYSKPYGKKTFIFDRLSLVLDNVQDPGNLGTIIRLADWFGVRDIYCSPDTADCWNPKVVQATMGAILRVRLHYRPLGDLLDQAVSAGVPLYGTFLEGEDIYRADLEPDKGILIMGNEGRGISAEIAGRVTHKLYIPSYGEDTSDTSESLNVAMATAIALSEFRRR